MTLSAADAATHAVENPLLHSVLGDSQLLVTLALLALLAAVFLKGFREAIGLAAVIAIPYLLLNGVVIVRGLVEILLHPEKLGEWHVALLAQGDMTGLILASAIVFPKLALGLSGFETGVSVMPLVRGGGPEAEEGPPVRRIAASRKLLASAAILMSVFLLSSSWVTTVLIPPTAYAEGGKAAGRALAYLAHDLIGSGFGTLYDLVTILILWFAGASALAGLLSLVPRYLPRFGMAPRWTVHTRPLVLVFLAVNVLVTLVFRADVEAQAGAYATGVLVLMLSAAFAVALALGHEARAGGPEGRGRRRALAGFFWAVTAVFVYTLADNVIARPDGVVISGCFVAAILALGGVSRYRRSTELRVAKISLADDDSKTLWPGLLGKKVNLVPLRSDSPDARRAKAVEIRKYYAVQGPVAFVHVNLADNRSEFLASLRVRVRREPDGYVLHVAGAVAVANTIAYLSEMMDPISLFLGLTRQNLMTQALNYLLWGEGETGLMVYMILVRYWEWTPEDDVRPLIFLMST